MCRFGRNGCLLCIFPPSRPISSSPNARGKWSGPGGTCRPEAPAQCGEVAKRSKETEATKDANIPVLAGRLKWRRVTPTLERTSGAPSCISRSLPKQTARIQPRPLLSGRDDHFALQDRPAARDIGKVGIPDRILFKPGPLTEEEFDTIVKEAHDSRVAGQFSRCRSNSVSAPASPRLTIATTPSRKVGRNWLSRGPRGRKSRWPHCLMAIADAFTMRFASRSVGKKPLSQ